MKMQEKMDQYRNKITETIIEATQIDSGKYKIKLGESGFIFMGEKEFNYQYEEVKLSTSDKLH